MPREIYPSSYECDCGHQSHFCENTVREMKAMSQKKKVYLGDSERDEHTIVFFKGKMVDIICPHQKAGKPDQRSAPKRDKHARNQAVETFEDKVRRTIEQLQHSSLQAMASDITQKRMAWLDRVLPDRPGYGQFTPRDAFELLFFEHMQLERSELPIVSESPDEVVWLSRNRCSLLEGCLALGLDTRKVCRAVNEKATQAFLSRINPQLRFYRSYDEIRPHADWCREKIVRTDLAAYMRIALQEAQLSRSEGNKGYGAVVVFDNKIIGQAHDTAITERDPSLHAEVSAIRQAVKTKNDPDLCGAILISTCEPCPMCASLAVWANVTTIVYGVSIQETARLGRSRILISASELVARSPCSIEVIGNILHTECKLLYQ